MITRKKLIKKNIVYLLIIINYLLLTGCFGFYYPTTFVIAGIKVTDAAIMVTIVITILLSIKGDKFTVKKNRTIGIWVLFLVFSFVRGMAVFNLSTEFMFRNVRTYFYIVPYFLVTGYYFEAGDKGQIGDLVLLILKLEAIHAFLFVLNFMVGMVGSPFLITTRVMDIAAQTVPRNYQSPLLLIFDLLIILNIGYLKSYKSLYIWVRRNKLPLLLIVGGTILLSFTRGVYITAILAIILNLGFVAKKNLGIIGKVIFVGVTIALILVSPVGSAFLEYTIEDISEGDKVNNFSLRKLLFMERFEYLQRTDNVLLGIGPRMDSDPNQNIEFEYGHETQRGIYTGDMGYTTVVLQYGLLGTAIYLMIFLRVLFVKSKLPMVKMIKIQMLVSIILFYESANLITYSNMFSLCILIGILDREKEKGGWRISEHLTLRKFTQYRRVGKTAS